MVYLPGMELFSLFSQHLGPPDSLRVSYLGVVFMEILQAILVLG